MAQKRSKAPSLNLWRRLFGKTLVQSIKSKEVHNLKAEKGVCMVSAMRTYRYLTWKQFKSLYSEGSADGCYHCMRKYSKKRR